MPPAGAPFLDRLYYLILPAIPLMLLELGYIARMARVGTVQELNKPYIRTAVLKGLPRRRVIFGHVLRNALVPTVTVIGSQVGWLIGGLLVVETCSRTPASATSCSARHRSTTSRCSRPACSWWR